MYFYFWRYIWLSKDSSKPTMKMIIMNNFSEDSCYEMNQSKFQNDKN